MEAAVAQAMRMVAEGADIIDVGGESTRPGHDPVSEPEELARVSRVVGALRARAPDLPISIDTSKIRVAEAALAAGADIVNDVTAVTAGAALAGVAAARGAPYILMHSRAVAVYDDVVREVVEDLRAALGQAERAGCDRVAAHRRPGYRLRQDSRAEPSPAGQPRRAPRARPPGPPGHQPQVHHRQGPRPAGGGTPGGHAGHDRAGHRRARGHRARPRRGRQRPCRPHE